MGRFLVRITIIFISLYFIYSCYLAQYKGVDVLDDWYSVLLLAIIVIYSFSEGKYHCRYIKFLAVSILISDTLTRLDNAYNFLSVTAHNLIPIFVIALGITVSLILAIHHFYKVTKLKRKRL